MYGWDCDLFCEESDGDSSQIGLETFELLPRCLSLCRGGASFVGPSVVARRHDTPPPDIITKRQVLKEESIKT